VYFCVKDFDFITFKKKFFFEIMLTIR